MTVVGGSDSALETAIALTIAGADVTLSYRGPSLREQAEKINEQLANPNAQVGLEQPLWACNLGDHTRHVGYAAELGSWLSAIVQM